MIEYTPNRSWVDLIRHLGLSWTLKRIGRAVFVTGVYATIVSALVLHFEFEAHRLISGAFSLLGIILSLVLAFRTNTAYDRWWEGRKLWGPSSITPEIWRSSSMRVFPPIIGGIESRSPG